MPITQCYLTSILLPTTHVQVPSGLTFTLFWFQVREATILTTPTNVVSIKFWDCDSMTSEKSHINLTYNLHTRHLPSFTTLVMSECWMGTWLTVNNIIIYTNFLSELEIFVLLFCRFTYIKLVLTIIAELQSYYFADHIIVLKLNNLWRALCHWAISHHLSWLLLLTK